MKYNTLIKILSLTIIFFTACSDKKVDRTDLQVTKEQVNQIYTCPMHPSVVSAKSGACPVCGMALIRKIDQQNTTTKDLSMVHSVSISPTQRVIANVATEYVKTQTISYQIDAVGIVDFAEPNLTIVTARFSGRIEKLYVNYTGAILKKGQPLFEVYSPDLITAQNEFLLAVKNQQETLIQASHDRLKFHFGLSEQQINEIEKNQKIFYIMPINAQTSGTVIYKGIQEGQYIDEGMILYKLADLSTVWVYLDVYEKDIQFIKIGSPVQIKIEPYINEVFKGKVTFIDPILNNESRTVRVRTKFSNPTKKLKPQMYVTAHITAQSKKTMVVPSSAVIFTGKRNVVWVEVKENTFEPRDIITGIRSGDYIEILSGINNGDKVVVKGGFLLESESQLQNPTSISHDAHTNQKGNNMQHKLNAYSSNEITIVVDGNYSPSIIHVRKDQKLTINFERRDDSKCTDEVIFPNFNIRKYLTPYKTTTIEFTPTQIGEFRFHCGMNMLEGKVIVHE